MINSIIIKYLQENRRLVIPKLGAFIVKDDNQTVIFSELLRSDDGVLRGLIKGHGVGDIEAAGVIDRFVFEVRHTLDRNMPYKIGNWGTLRRNETGKIIFMSFRAQLQQTQVRQAPKPQPNFAVNTAAASNEPNTATAIDNAREADSPKRQPAQRKPDLFMIVAIVVSVIAICAILYGVLCNSNDPEPMPFSDIESYEPGFDSGEEFTPTEYGEQSQR